MSLEICNLLSWSDIPAEGSKKTAKNDFSSGRIPSLKYSSRPEEGTLCLWCTWICIHCYDPLYPKVCTVYCWMHTCGQIQLPSREVCVLYQHVYSLAESKTRRARKAYTTGRDTEVRSGSEERREHLQEFINRRYCRSSIIMNFWPIQLNIASRLFPHLIITARWHG